MAVWVSPWRFTSTMNSEMPWVRFGASATGTVRATISILSACGTPVIQIFRPFTRQPLPSRRAKVRTSRLLDPASGSVSPLLNVISPEHSFRSHCRLTSSVPSHSVATPPPHGFNNKTSARPHHGPRAHRPPHTRPHPHPPQPPPPHDP